MHINVHCAFTLLAHIFIPTPFNPYNITEAANATNFKLLLLFCASNSATPKLMLSTSFTIKYATINRHGTYTSGTLYKPSKKAMRFFMLTN